MKREEEEGDASSVLPTGGSVFHCKESFRRERSARGREELDHIRPPLLSCYSFCS